MQNSTSLLLLSFSLNLRSVNLHPTIKFQIGDGKMNMTVTEPAHSLLPIIQFFISLLLLSLLYFLSFLFSFENSLKKTHIHTHTHTHGKKSHFPAIQNQFPPHERKLTLLPPYPIKHSYFLRSSSFHAKLDYLFLFP